MLAGLAQHSKATVTLGRAGCRQSHLHGVLHEFLPLLNIVVDPLKMSLVGQLGTTELCMITAVT